MLNFIGPMKEHLVGHKELTSDKEVKILPGGKEVAIALQRGNATVECLVEVGQKVKIGDMIGRQNDFFYVPFFASVSGRVKAIEKRLGINLKPTDYVVIENDGLDTFAELPKLDADKASKDEIVAFLKEKGIIGCGGAGFPTYFKYQTEACKTLIINAVECEPYITADALSVETWPEDFAYGLRALFKASGAEKCYVAVKENKYKLIPFLLKAIEGIENCELIKVKDFYPMGWERTLIYEILKKRYERLPIEIGVILSNATTVIMAAKAMKTGLPIYQKIVTVSGDAVKQPQNVLLRVGTSFVEVVEACGGFTAEKVRMMAGGPMMGFTVNKENITIAPATNAVTVLRDNPQDEWACLRCGRCIEHCPAGLMPVNIMEAVKSNNADRMILLHPMDCIECGLCTYVCPSKISVTDQVRKAKRLLALRIKK